MDTSLDVRLAEGYESPCQRVRVITEGWFAKAMYCPACPGQRLVQARANTRVVDFCCADCGSEFQVKARSAPLGGKLRDAAYQPMMDRILRDLSPHFALMEYDASAWLVRNLVLVPKHFITPSIIEKCPPLSERARRAGWTGCNILTNMIPDDGRVFAVREGACVPPHEVRSQWKRFSWMANRRAEDRGWLADVLRCVRLLGETFTLAEVYEFEADFAIAHPGNRHIREKIRQQLQLLRDRGIIRFLGRGRYQAA